MATRYCLLEAISESLFIANSSQLITISYQLRDISYQLISSIPIYCLRQEDTLHNRIIFFSNKQTSCRSVSSSRARGHPANPYSLLHQADIFHTAHTMSPEHTYRIHKHHIGYGSQNIIQGPDLKNEDFDLFQFECLDLFHFFP